jgi:ubiquitin-like modifier-activating enzyme ATG7
MAGAGAAGFPRLLKAQALQCLADEGFWDALRRHKLDILGTDDSPIPITGPPAPNPSPCCLFVEFAI